MKSPRTRARARSLALILLLGGGLGPAVAVAAAAAAAAESELAQLSFTEFDQSDGKGWRALAESGKRREAAQLIERYLAESKKLHKAQRFILHFHAGQCYASAGDTELAVARFQQSYQAEEPAHFAPLARQWNAYVRGTIAFLKGDRAALERSRAEVAAGPEGSMRDSNVDVLERLLRGLGKSYRDAYDGR